MVIGVTGASSEIGHGVLRTAQSLGIDTVPFGRSSNATKHYDLREPISHQLLNGVDAVIHLAWAWDEPGQVNVEAGRSLAAACHERGIAPVLLSTFSVFAADKSDYGAAKLEVEREFLSVGGSALRAGVIWGAAPSGIVATLARLASLPGLSPYLWPDPLLHHSQEAELSRALIRGALGQTASRIALAASRETASLRTLMAMLRGERRAVHIPVAVPAVQLLARGGERLHLGLPFRSDSLSALDRRAGRAITDSDLPWIDTFPGTAPFFEWARSSAANIVEHRSH